MYKLILSLHVIVCVLLLIIILIQRGRGGGFIESLSGADSLFGTKTSAFLVKLTTVLAILFFVCSTSLAFLSRQRSRSVLERKTQDQINPKKKDVKPKNDTGNKDINDLKPKDDKTENKSKK